MKEPWLFSIIGNYTTHLCEGVPSTVNHETRDAVIEQPNVSMESVRDLRVFWSVARLLSETLVELEASQLSWWHSATLPGSPNAPSTTVVVTWLFFGGGKGGGMVPVVEGKHFFVEGKPKTAGIRFLVNQKKKTQWKMKWTLWKIRSSYWKWVFRRLVCTMFDPEMFTYLNFFLKTGISWYHPIF